MTTLFETEGATDDPARSRTRRSASIIVNTAIVLSVPIVALLLGEGVIRPTLPLALALGLLWLIGVVTWLRSGSRSWNRLRYPVPIAAIAVALLALLGRAGEVPFNVSEHALESHAEGVLADRAAGQSIPPNCYTDELQRHRLILAAVSCGLDGQVVYKTSIRPLLGSAGERFNPGNGNQVGGFVYVADPATTEPYVFGWPCRFDQLSEHFHRYSCEMSRPIWD